MCAVEWVGILTGKLSSKKKIKKIWKIKLRNFLSFCQNRVLADMKWMETW